MNKYAAEKIAQEYYNLGVQLAFEKIARIDLGDIQEAMEAQDALYRGSIEDRIGTALEQRRREGAVTGTLGGGLAGTALGAMAGRGKGKAIATLAALLGGGAGAVGGNLLGRGLGMVSGGAEGALNALPGVRHMNDYLSKPLADY